MACLDILTSPNATADEQLKAITAARGELAKVAENKQGSLSAWLHIQDSLRGNSASVILTFLAVSVVQLRFTKITQRKETLQTVSKALLLLQGLLLLHRRSAEFFERPSNIQILLHILFIAQEEHNNRPITPDAASTQNTASLISLLIDTFLAVLADRPANIRAFENEDGIAAISGLLRSRTTPKHDRVKCVEFLYFYLQPEDTTRQQPSTLTTSLTKSPSARRLSPSILPSTPRRGHVRDTTPNGLQKILEETEAQWVPRTPRKSKASMARSPSSDEMPPPLPVGGALLRSSTAKRLDILARSPSAQRVAPSLPSSSQNSPLVSPSVSKGAGEEPSKRPKRPPALPLGDATNYFAVDSPRSKELDTAASPARSPRKGLAESAMLRAHRKSASQSMQTPPATPLCLSRSTSGESPLSKVVSLPRSCGAHVPASATKSEPPTMVSTPGSSHSRRVSQDSTNQSMQSSASSIAFSFGGLNSPLDVPCEGGIRSEAQKRQILSKYLGGVEELVERLQHRPSLGM